MPAQPEQIWNEIRAELRAITPDFKFHIWLEPLELAGIDGRTLYVRAPEHIRSSVAERYLPLLRRAATSAFDERAVVEVVGSAWKPAAGDADPAPPPENRDRLNPKCTFDQFVIGAGNRFAHAAALAVAELPAHSYNPLFLHGSPGIGKTHLLHAIGNYVERYGSGLRVRYATIEEFTTQFVEAVRRRRTEEFKQSFRSADVMLIDDVQFLSGRTRTREEFFHTFNAVTGAGRQLVMTSDRAPEDIPGLEARLIERFRSGLVVEVEAPGLDVRQAILAKRARLDNVGASDEVLAAIAARVNTSVRALEGALIRVVAYASLKGEPATPETVEHVLRRLGTDPSSLGEILDATAQEFGVEPNELLAPGKQPARTLARQVAMYLAKDLTTHSDVQIATAVRRDRATVSHGVKRITTLMETDRDVRNSVDNVRRRLSSPRS